MTYTGEMVLPRNAVVMDTEEMRYVDGGFRMKTSNAAKILRVGFAIAGIFFSKGTLVKSVIKRVGKKKATNKAYEFALKLGVTKSRANAVKSIIGAYLGFSMGDYVAEGLDRIDGKKDGWITC